MIDSRGHGRSTMPAVPLSYEQMADDVIAVLDRLRIRRTSVVGLSDGGIIGLLLAIHHPERIDRLFVWGATFNTHADSDAAYASPAVTAADRRAIGWRSALEFHNLGRRGSHPESRR